MQINTHRYLEGNGLVKALIGAYLTGARTQYDVRKQGTNKAADYSRAAWSKFHEEARNAHLGKPHPLGNPIETQSYTNFLEKKDLVGTENDPIGYAWLLGYKARNSLFQHERRDMLRLEQDIREVEDPNKAYEVAITLADKSPMLRDSFSGTPAVSPSNGAVTIYPKDNMRRGDLVEAHKGKIFVVDEIVFNNSKFTVKLSDINILCDPTSFLVPSIGHTETEVIGNNGQVKIDLGDRVVKLSGKGKEDGSFGFSRQDVLIDELSKRLAPLNSLPDKGRTTKKRTAKKSSKKKTTKKSSRKKTVRKTAKKTTKKS